MRTLILLLLLFCLIRIETKSTQNEIKSLVIFFRHGSRTTHHKHFFHEDHWNGYEKGDLTKKGHDELHGLGQTFKEIYEQFLQVEVHDEKKEQQINNNNNVKVKHSHITRTKQSLMSFLLGAFPSWFHPEATPHNHHLHKPNRKLKLLKNKQKLNKDFTFLLGEEQCPLIRKIRDLIFISKPMNFVQDIITQSYEYQKIRRKIKETKGFDQIQGHGYEDLADIYDFYMCHKSEGLPIPNFDKSDLSFILMGAQFYIDYIYFGHRSLVKLSSQQFFQDLLNILEDKHPQKLHIFSGHEVNIVSLFMNMLTREEQNTILGASFNTKLLPFAAHVIIEFLQNGNVKFLYDFKPLKIKLCSYQEECDGKWFKVFLKTRIVPHSKKLCYYHHKHILEREEYLASLKAESLNPQLSESDDDEYQENY